jgi:hypothetical protein
MRRHCALLLACSLWVLPWAFGGAGAAAVTQFTRPSAEAEAQSVLEAKYLCGLSGCRFVPGGIVEHGKSATPGVINPPDDAPEGATGEPDTTAPAGIPGQGAQTGGAAQELVKPGEHACPPGYRVLAVPTQSGYCEPMGTPEAANPACPHGMVGTPPSNCHCPPSSELLGGNCVHYHAICRNGLAADVAPQQCASADEKLACKLRPDGLKDCCCLTYDKE